MKVLNSYIAYKAFYSYIATVVAKNFEKSHPFSNSTVQTSFLLFYKYSNFSNYHIEIRPARLFDRAFPTSSKYLRIWKLKLDDTIYFTT